jgi:hypothetical protein
VLGKKFAKVPFSGLEGKISYVQFHFYLFEVATSQPTNEVRAQARIRYLWERTEQKSELRHYYLASVGSNVIDALSWHACTYV